MTGNQIKALSALKGARLHAEKIGNPEMAWIAAGACGIAPATFLSLVNKGLADKRPAKGDCSRKWDYRVINHG
jgi:hypothetical protein